MAILITLLLLFALPFLVIPFGFSSFETPKVIAAQILIQTLFLIHLLKHGLNFKLFNKRLLYMTGGLFVLSCINLLLHTSGTTFFGNPFRSQGTYLFWCFLLFTLLSSAISLPKIEKPFFIFLLSIELILTICMGQTITHRFYGSLGEPHSLAAFALFIFPFALFAPLNRSHVLQTIASFIALLLTFVLIFISGSRSGMIGLFIECFILFLTFKIGIRKAMFVGIFLLLLTFCLPFTKQALYENRSDVWMTAAVAGAQKPITGWGNGNIEYAFIKVSPQMHNEIKNQYVDSSHNFLLDWWVQGGIIGVMLVLTLLYFTFKRFCFDKNRRELMILFGILSVMVFNPVSVTILIVFWWLIGQGFYTSKEAKI